MPLPAFGAKQFACTVLLRHKRPCSAVAYMVSAAVQNTLWCNLGEVKIDEAVCFVQTPAQAGEPASYFCQSIRMMPLASIDPSLAIGFYCRTLGAAPLKTAGSNALGLFACMAFNLLLQLLCCMWNLSGDRCSRACCLAMQTSLSVRSIRRIQAA